MKAARELDAAHTTLDTNLKKAKGLDQLAATSDKTAKVTVKVTTGLKDAAAGTRVLDKDSDKATKKLKGMGSEMDHVKKQSTGLFQTLRNGFSVGGGGGGILGGGIIPGLANISSIIRGIPQIGQLAHAIVTPLTEAAEEGIRLNMLLETTEIAFTQVAGSAEKAHQHVMKLQAFGAASPFRFEGLLKGAQLMNAFGFSIDEQIPKLRVWGNAIAASGEISEESVHRVITAFGQMRMAGRVNAQDMMQLTNANIPGWQLLAKSIGKTVAETRKMAEAGKLNGKVAVEAITAMMAIDPRFAGMMDKLQSTTTGRLSALQDTIQIAQGTATEGMTANISKMIQDALDRPDIIPGMATQINAILTPVSGLIETGIKTVLTPGITTGLVEGINFGKTMVKDAVIGMAEDSIIGSFKGVLGIQSPSKVFYDLGFLSAQGYMLGLQDGFLGAGGQLKDILERLLLDPKVRAFFEAITKAEGGGLNIMAGGRRVDSGALHPGEVVPKSQWFRGDKGPSSAAGLFQITRTNWRQLAPQLGLTNFSDPNQQMLAALKLFADREKGKGLEALLRGDIVGARNVAALDWTSTPGSKIGGGGQVSAKKWMGYYNQALASGGGAPAGTASDPLWTRLSSGAGGNSPLLMSGPGNTERATGFRSLGDQSGNIFSNPELLQTSVSGAAAMTLNLKKLEPMIVGSAGAAKELADEIARGTEETKLGVGQWYEQMTAIGSVQQQLGEEMDRLPKFREMMTDIFVSIPSRFGDIVGDAVGRADGSLSGFWQSIKSGFLDTIQSMLAQAASNQAQKVAGSILTGIMGKPEMDPNSGEATGRSTGGVGWMKKVLGWFGVGAGDAGAAGATNANTSATAANTLAVTQLTATMAATAGVTAATGGGGGGLWGTIFGIAMNGIAGGIGGGGGKNPMTSFTPRTILSGSGIPGFARGGRPPVGSAIMMGDDPSGRPNPEIFVPDSAGTVLPLKGLGGKHYHLHLAQIIQAPNGKVAPESSEQAASRAMSAMASFSAKRGGNF